ncbi:MULTISPECIES: serine hydrolase domain-containing protein [Mycolicibacterium]|uniref:Penicillin-binding protein, beta-lactamase class C n=3 Tax=Mycolicibacterium gilvum TaxID=1804 RepID=E6TFE3_MYCSR|nr:MULTISPECIES: serine hydrolase domain-containing protein [Mycolicibacterium]ABP45246.1 beta-lactamase [Mycolicibacterium gilvum PYR-GCK]ADT98859.1 penicillin-binding protein, beta-lactamase class C [Mycolicibacterium gilvum Spyr1]MBV5244474.1 beta-lactamase family protein [Mycolicibacterium sp. PAM1]MCV7057625.1 beta-lactamase family protein [Mycolicibacterium gilvum]STZ44439.1 beta-lactamase [Mycolicibacterium gilvum]
MSALDVLSDWPVPNVAAAVVGGKGVLADHGDTRHRFPLASVTKLLVARAAQIAVEEGAVELDSAAGPTGSTVRHLLAHTAGYEMTSSKVIARPGTRRVYSNYGFTVLAETIESESLIPFPDYLAESVFAPLNLGDTDLDGGAEAAGYGVTSTVEDLVAFAGDLLTPALVSQQMHDDAISVQFPGLDGVLPGFGVQRPNDWGLGFEIRDGKSPHWTGGGNSPGTFGHFGQSGTFLWVDPGASVALIVLTDRTFGDWAHAVMPALSDEVLREFGAD